ncbi:helix-turn-helix transcriptional regulator [Roseateles sp. P5_E1]
MTLDARKELAVFLTSRRARLGPADVGLPSGARRRARGLRREEVAALAGIGVTWYTWLEQARPIRVSASALERVADALRLGSTERAHLLALAGHPAPAVESAAIGRVVDDLSALVGSLTLPAYLKTKRWDLLAWNEPLCQLFGDFSSLPAEARNQLWLTFTSPLYRERMADWEIDARDVLARFRVDFGRSNGDPGFAALVARTAAASPEFRAWWAHHDVVADRSTVRKTLRHPVHGEVPYNITSFTPDGAPDLRLTIFRPEPPVV